MFSYIPKPRPMARKWKTLRYQTWRQWTNADIKKKWAPFSSLTLCVSYENLHRYPQNLLWQSNRSKVNHILVIFYAVYTANSTLLSSVYSVLNCCRWQDGCQTFLFSKQKWSWRTWLLTPCNMHSTPCNMRKILHGYFSVKWMGIFLCISWYEFMARCYLLNNSDVIW